MRVFVSSTVLDLIDVRAEVEALLREMRLTPVLSDRATSGFEVETDKNAVHCCLSNLAGCDHVLLILSQRYGSVVEHDGQTLSVTHLEYREAKRLGKPVHVYIRDRLSADVAIVNRNPGGGTTLSWIRDERDRQLVVFVNEHTASADGNSSSNWVQTFRDSTELKDLIRKDLRLPASRADLTQRVKDGTLPWLDLNAEVLEEATPRANRRLVISLRNRTAIPAFRCTLRFQGEGECVPPLDLPALGPNADFSLQCNVPNDQTDREWKAEVTYLSPTGHEIRDSYCGGRSHQNYLEALAAIALERKVFTPAIGNVEMIEIR